MTEYDAARAALSEMVDGHDQAIRRELASHFPPGVDRIIRQYAYAGDLAGLLFGSTCYEQPNGVNAVWTGYVPKWNTPYRGCCTGIRVVLEIGLVLEYSSTVFQTVQTFQKSGRLRLRLISCGQIRSDILLSVERVWQFVCTDASDQDIDDWVRNIKPCGDYNHSDVGREHCKVMMQQLPQQLKNKVRVAAAELWCFKNQYSVP
jgi:hypothetical protein